MHIQNEDLSVNFKLVNWPQKGGHISGPASAFQWGLSLDFNSKTLFVFVFQQFCCLYVVDHSDKQLLHVNIFRQLNT